MDIKFNGKGYYELVNELFDDISNEYNLGIVNKSNNVIELNGNDFSILFTYDLDTSWIYYYDKNDDKTYLISNYINVNAEDIDRKDIPKEDIISKEIERTLRIQARVISRKFCDLLRGETSWFVSSRNQGNYLIDMRLEINAFILRPNRFFQGGTFLFHSYTV